MKPINGDVVSLGKSQYNSIIGYDDMEKDEDGFLRLIPTADRVDKQVETLTTDISSLEAKLKEFRAKKEKAVKYQKSDEYKEDKKLKSKKKKKKEKATLLSMVFNNADHAGDDDDDIDEEDEENYRDKKKKSSEKKDKETTLDTTYGKRFSPVVSMLYDTIADFDQIARDIEVELDSGRGTAKSMYRSSQIGNIISAKNSKLSAVKELAAVAKTVSELEYKKEKDKKSEEGSDTTKAISNLGAKFLRGAFELEDEKGSGKKGKKKDKDKGKIDFSSGKKGKKSLLLDDDDDDDEEDSIKKAERKRDEQELAGEFAKAILKNKDSIKFTAHEKHMNMEGKYTFVVGCDPLDPENTYKFIAIDPKSGKEIKGFKDDYKELMPKKKLVRLKFDINKKKAYDANSGRSYKLVFFN